MSFRVFYVDRIYGWKNLLVKALNEAQAVALAINYLGFEPQVINAAPDLEVETVDHFG